MTKYATLTETDCETGETWYYFINMENNQEELKFLAEQLDTIEEMGIYDEDVNAYCLDVTNPVSAETAREMTRLHVNNVTPHRKFDGKMKKIDFKFKERHHDLKRQLKVTETIGNGRISLFVENEEVNPTWQAEFGDSESSSTSSSESSESRGRETRRREDTRRDDERRDEARNARRNEANSDEPSRFIKIKQGKGKGGK